MAFSVAKVLTKVFGSRNDRLLKRYRAIVDRINEWEPKVAPLTDEQLRARTAELRAGLIAKKLRPVDVMPEAMGIIREAMDRHIGIREIFNPEQNFDPDQLDDDLLAAYDEVQQRMIATGESYLTVPIPHKLYAAVRKLYPESRPPFRARPFDVQMIGGLVLSEGRIAEMATGEGKTFVAPLACFLRVLEGMHCHVVTVNDYLVRRDASWVRPAFEALGLSVGYIQADMDPGSDSRRTQYGADTSEKLTTQDGYTAGHLQRFSASADGTLLGQYSNGQTKPLGQVVLANFTNAGGLEPIGNNSWTETSASGTPLLGVAGTGGFGVLQSSATESSNVDLTAELVNMITAQRVYQANAQTIKTQDSVLQTLVNLR